MEYSSISFYILIIAVFNTFPSALVDNNKECQCVPFNQCNNSEKRNIDILKLNTKKCLNESNVIKKLNENEAQFAEFPWMIAIFRKLDANNDYQYHCGGSLIDPEIVLTAAHCVYFERKSPKNFRVRAGEWNMQNTYEILPHQERFVKKIIVHNEFYSGGLFHDIAMLILEKPFENSVHINTIRLVNSGTGSEFFGKNDCFACGWGESNFKTNQKILKKIQLPIVSSEQCVKQLRKTNLGKNFQLHRTFLCAGGEQKIDTCKGDGGSPLVCPIKNNTKNFQQVGIVSWGIGCGQKNVPGVYVNVATLINWIDDQLYYNNYNLSKYRY